MSEQAIRAVELAVAAAGPMGPRWRRNVYESLGEITALLRENSEAVTWSDKILAADVFQATYLGYELEIPEGMTRPTRLIVETQSDKAINESPGPRHNPDGIEHVRSEPLWTKAGRLMQQRLDNLPVGSVIAVHKIIEEPDAGRKVRIIVHFDIVRLNRNGSTQSSSAGQDSARPAAAEGTERQAETPSPSPGEGSGAVPPSPAPEPHSRDDNAALGRVGELFEALSGRQRVAYAHWCRGVGIEDVMVPDADKMPTAISKLEELTGGE